MNDFHNLIEVENKYLLKVGAQSFENLNAEQRVQIFLISYNDLVIEHIDLNQFSKINTLLVEFTNENSGLEYDIFNATLHASSLSKYADNLISSARNRENFVTAIESIKDFINKYKNTLS